MAQVIRKAVAPVAVQKKQAVQRAQSPVDLIDGAEVLTEDGIEFLGREGGRAASPETQALRDKVSGLKIGQGFVVPKDMRIARKITNQAGQTSTIYTYKGANAVSKLAKANGKRFRTRRDVSGKMYIFRVTPLEVAEVEQAEE